MTAPQQIRFGDTAGVITFDAPEGRPSSVTSLAVREDTQSDTTTAETAFGSPSVETNPNTTFDAASGVSQSNQDRANLTATTGIVLGRTYLATNAYGDKEWCEVVDISSGAYVTVRNAFANDYTTADTFQSTRITATVDATWVADTSNKSHPLCPNAKWRAEFTYVVSSFTYTAQVFFDLVAEVWRHSITGLVVDGASRGWLARLAAEDRADQGKAVIDRAAHEVKVDIWEHGVADWAWSNRATLNELVTWKAVIVGARGDALHGGDNVRQLQIAMAEYDGRMQRLVNSGIAAATQTEDGAAAPVERAPVWRR